MAKNSHFWPFFGRFLAMDKKVNLIRSSYFCCSFFKLFAMYAAKENDIRRQGQPQLPPENWQFFKIFPKNRSF